MRKDRQAIDLRLGPPVAGLPGVVSTDVSTAELSYQTSRVERLAAIWEALADGSYRVDSDHIAGKLVESLSKRAIGGSVDQALDKDEEHR